MQRRGEEGVDDLARDRRAAAMLAGVAVLLFLLTTWIVAVGDWSLLTESSDLERFVVLSLIRLLWVPVAVLALRRWSTVRHQEGQHAGTEHAVEHQATWEAAAREREREAHAGRVRQVLDAADSLVVHFQPIVSLSDGAVVELEALSRFRCEPSLAPDAWFRKAHALGMGIELELHAVEQALAALHSFPPMWSVALNLSATTLTDAALADLLAPWPAERVSVELTEHEEVLDYDRLRECLQPLRDLGLRLGVDDAGAGFSSMRHILKLRPDFVKLDRSVTSGIHHDAGKQALATSLVSFAREIGAAVVAEGVEEKDEVVEMIRLGADFAQGYYFDRPSQKPAVLAYSIPVPPSH